MKKPWYIWLSILGFMGVLFVTMFKIFIKRRPIDIGLWTRCCGKFILLFFVFFMFPIAAVLLVMGQLCIISSATNYILNILTIIIAYALGVLITERFYQWSAQEVG